MGRIVNRQSVLTRINKWLIAYERSQSIITENANNPNRAANKAYLARLIDMVNAKTLGTETTYYDQVINNGTALRAIDSQTVINSLNLIEVPQDRFKSVTFYAEALGVHLAHATLRLDGQSKTMSWSTSTLWKDSFESLPTYDDSANDICIGAYVYANVNEWPKSIWFNYWQWNLSGVFNSQIRSANNGYTRKQSFVHEYGNNGIDMVFNSGNVFDPNGSLHNLEWEFLIT